jgi:CPA1 family monovalent cation:H+ antiporter
MQNIDVIVVVLFAVATVVALLVRKLLVPYTVGLVLAGLLLGATHVLRPPQLTKELLFAVFLPGLLFEAAFHLDFSRFWRSKVAIVSLAVPGVIASIAVTAALLTPMVSALHFVQDFKFIHGLVFAALLAATDPIAVVALFKTLGVPSRLGVLIEGESLLNDGTAVVFFGIILGIASGQGASIAGATREFVRVVGGGFLVGGIIGMAASQIIRRVDEAMIEITLTTLAAYGSFVASEHLHVSGVIATVTAGMLCGNYAAKSGMSPSTRLAVDSFWEYLAFALNSLVFLLIGFEVELSAVVAVWKPILVAFVALTLGRAVVIACVSLALGRSREKIPWSWAAVLTWGGLRGALSMVLALSLAKDFPHRDILVSLTFGVVIVSIFAQGLTMAPLLRWFGVVRVAADRRAYDFRRGQIVAVQAALDSLDQAARSHAVASEMVTLVRQEYEVVLSAAEAEIGRVRQEHPGLRNEALVRLKRYLAAVERNAIGQAARHGLIDSHVAQELSRAVDARLASLAGSSSEEEDL